MKKIVSLFLIFCLCAGMLGGCGSKEAVPEDMSGDVYNIGVKAVKVLDKYLAADMDLETAQKEISNLSDQVSTAKNDDMTKDLFVSIDLQSLSWDMLQMQGISPTVTDADIKDKRDALAEDLGIKGELTDNDYDVPETQAESEAPKEELLSFTIKIEDAAYLIKYLTADMDVELLDLGLMEADDGTYINSLICNDKGIAYRLSADENMYVHTLEIECKDPEMCSDIFLCGVASMNFSSNEKDIAAVWKELGIENIENADEYMTAVRNGVSYSLMKMSDSYMLMVQRDSKTASEFVQSL